MGTQELLDYFSDYDATKARHAYGPGGHRGMSVLIFESSAVGYMEAERLHKHFVDQNTDRGAWQNRKARFLPGGKRQLYGFLAKKEDMEDFNKHCQGITFNLYFYTMPYFFILFCHNNMHPTHVPGGFSVLLYI
jgi:hypothetical protein